MCRNFGMMGPGIQNKDFKIFKDLGIMCQMGGLDGAGVYQVRSAQYTKGWSDYERVLKSPNNFSSLITDIEDDASLPYNKREYKDLLTSVQVDIVLGHVRAQTIGEISEKNAHPFVFKNIVGAHNGTLRDKKYMSDDTTDSEMMFADINERGLIPVLNSMDKNGAFAICMYNRDDHCMYFTRNEDRTLSFAFLEDRGVMFWSTELSVLKFVLERHGEKYKACSLLPYKVVRIYAPDITLKKIGEDFLSLLTVVDEIEHRPPVKTKGYNYRNGWREEELTFTRRDDSQYVMINGIRLPKNSVEKKEDNQESLPFTEKDTTTSCSSEKSKNGKSIKQFYTRCACEKHEINLIGMHYARRGLNNDFRYEDVGDKYFCKECDPVVFMKEDA